MQGKLENAQVGPACLMSWLYSISREQVEVTELESNHEVVPWLLMSQAHAFGCLIIFNVLSAVLMHRQRHLAADAMSGALANGHCTLAASAFLEIV